MPKPDAALLDPARYRFHCRMDTRFGDLDVNMHVNNVALIGILEDARVRFHHASAYSGPAMTTSSMVASLNVEFLAQTHYPAPLDIAAAVSDLGRTSYVVHQMVRQEARPVAYARAVMVCMNGDGPTPLPDAFRNGFAPWLLAP